MSDQTSEFHVAQHSRRERLRINSEQQLDPGILQPYQYRNISYDPSLVLSSEMLNFVTTSTESVVPSDVTQNCNTWKNVGTSCLWNNVANYSSGSGVIENNLSPMFVGGEGLNLNNIDVKPNFFGGYQEMQQSPAATNSSPTNNNMQFSTPVLYHDTLQEVVTSATAGTQGVETGRVGSWTENGNELLLLPNYIDQSRHLFGTNSSTKGHDNSNAQALALSLSPVPASKTNMVQMEKRNNAMAPENFAIAHRSAVPLGPFTGYATILKSSKFLRPAQQLLEELCELAAGSSDAIKCSNYSKKFHDGFRVSCDVNASESSSGAVVGDSGGSSESNVRPEYLQKKAKLIYMQDEICKRYKQYHQQMQMVVSSFETVAGLSAATPYISLALKTVSQHFKSLRNAISDHLKNIRQALGEDLPSPASGSKGDGTSSRLKFADQTLHKQKTGGPAVAFFESQQHVWRPQRGLPERAVAILRAWLFDHFLHPYPTDSDKHMLASQTGLTRNQVSNWFINARVRVWKPMVEEIHMLETRENGPTVRKSEGNKLVTERANNVNDGSHRGSSISMANCGQNLNVLNMSGMLEGPVIGPSERLDDHNDMWRNQEKRSRIECHIPSSMDGSLMGFVPYHQRNALEIGGSIGAVSLTLGLRQNAEAAQQQQLQQLHEHRLRQQFGGHMIHDFVD
ncbi:BEL1-like homeodomain protein 8 isoform X2 [Lycium barbarum]|nr:BEL1-like homeodomain protein 8 isoform X2 [Lycium barbarum]